MTSEIICCACSISAISVLQFALKHCKGAIERVVLDFSKSGDKDVMVIKIPGVQLLRKRKDQGDPLSAATERSHLTIIMNNLFKVLHQQVIQSGMITMFGPFKSIN